MRSSSHTSDDTVEQTTNQFEDGRATSEDVGEPSRARRARSRPLLVALGAAVLVVGVIVAAALWPRADSEPAVTAGATAADTPALLADVGHRAPAPLPDATLPPLADLGPADGIDLADLRGEPAILNFWASWCAPCVEEMPAMQRVAEDTGIRVIGIDYVDQNDKAAELARELGITYDLVRDDDGEFGRRVGLIGTPTTLFVDADGMIVRQLAAELSEEQIRETIEQVLR